MKIVNLLILSGSLLCVGGSALAESTSSSISGNLSEACSSQPACGLETAQGTVALQSVDRTTPVLEALKGKKGCVVIDVESGKCIEPSPATQYTLDALKNSGNSGVMSKQQSPESGTTKPVKTKMEFQLGKRFNE